MMNLGRPIGFFVYQLFLGAIAPALWLAAAREVHLAVPGDSLGAKIGAIPLLYPSLIAGLAAITAAVTAYLGSALKTAEDIRVAEIARRDERQSALLLASFVSQKVLGKCERARGMAARMEMLGFMPDELGGGQQISAKHDDYLRVEPPSELGDLLKNMAILPSVVRDALRDLTIGLEELQRITAPADVEDGTEYVHDRDSLLREYDRVIEAASIIMIAEGRP